jgi:hypothetical protein
LKVHDSVTSTTVRRDSKVPDMIRETNIVYIFWIAVIPTTQDGEVVKEARDHYTWQRAVISLIIGHFGWRWDNQDGTDKSNA